VLILTAAMGGGHVQVSRELGRRLAARGAEVKIAEFTELLPVVVGRWLRWLYPWLVTRTPWLYDVIYRRFFQAGRRGGGRVGPMVSLAMPRLRALVARVRPDVVVSTYHMAALAAGRLRARGGMQCPAVSFVTTFSVHNLWIHPGSDAELCICEQAAADAAARSGRPAQVCGPVVRPEFTGPAPDPGRVRAEVGIPTGRRVALVVAGSLGLGAVEAAAAAFAAAPGWVPVTVCGRNEALRQHLSGLAGGVTLGWVQDMAGLMAASDVLVENAGGLSAKEALRAGLPIVTFRPIAGHGRDDATALARLGLTDVVDDEPGLLAAAHRLVADPELRADRVDRGQKLFRADAAACLERIAGVHRAAAGRPVRPSWPTRVGVPRLNLADPPAGLAAWWQAGCGVFRTIGKSRRHG
jgi:UDP-N-acetylglucosamine:LPS N-acetylglucosamine transferase